MEGEQAPRWTVDRVVAAAPDPAAEVAGRKLAAPGPWLDCGCEGPMVWGSCRGSARTPYKVVVDTEAPRYQCSCPSRKFPCKHALGLLFLWAEGRLPDDGGTPPPAAVRRHRAEPAPTEVDLERLAERARQRDERVAAGLVELQQWLTDQVEAGLAGLAGHPERLEQLAARMVDAQAPALARWLRRLATEVVGVGVDWPARLLAELGSMWLLTETMRHRERLSPAELATVRGHLGYPMAQAEVLAQPGVRDEWVVFGLHDTDDDDRVQTRRVWLVGQRTGRFALVLFFSVNGAAYEMTMAPGMLLDAELHFHDTALPLRAVVGERFGEPEPQTPAWPLDAGWVGAVLDAYAAAVAVDPWLGLWPVAVRGRLGHDPEQGFGVVDADGAVLPVTGPETALWRAVAILGGAEASWLGEWDGSAYNPLAVVDDEATAGTLVVL